MVRANIGRGLMVIIGVVLVIVAVVALNMPDHGTRSGPAVAAAGSVSK